jgi:hypothetical protein
MMPIQMVRRLLVMIVVMAGTMLLVAAVTAVAETADNAQPPPASAILTEPPPRFVTGTPPAIPIPVEAADPDEPFSPGNNNGILNHAGNSCEVAGLLEFPQGGTGTGDSGSVRTLTQAASDPVLSCMWGNPLDPRGFRTAWYRFTVPRNGTVTISTFGSDYDTVLAVYTGGCDQLQMLACNDDYNMFSSQVRLQVRTGRTYYVQVADWSQSDTGSKNLELTVLLDPIDSDWVLASMLELARTRHIGLTVGPDLYVMGGFSDFSGGSNYQASARVDRWHIPTGQWTRLAAMPTGGNTRIGQFNSSGVYVNGRIHIPAGDDGGSNFAGQHWALNLDLGSPNPFPYWEQLAPVNWAAWTGGLPVGFAATVAAADGYYLIGGTTDASFLLNAVGYTFFYNTATNSWQQLADLNIPRYGHTAALVNGQPCVTGGLHINEDNELVLQDSTECYTPGNGGGTWTTITNTMHIARFGAGSAVGPDGKWYVFGGVGPGNTAVPELEMYDPAAARWSLLSYKADLGGTPESPARAWPRGGFAGNHLYAAGGNLVVNNTESGVLPFVERLYVAPFVQYIPFMQGVPANPAVVNNNFAMARFLPFHQPIQQNFATPLDYYDVFFFDLGAQQIVTLDLTNIPLTHDYDLLLYNSNKSLLAESRNLAGQNEQIIRNLGPGRYYVVVQRVLPPGLPDPNVYYRLLLR